ncbi:class I SAM-dependent DNA methyltransferase [Roseovarius sp. D0-M9]|uniref:class I SAM-dependent DNA methyltransferase n=1 Tax=Roseovarius sp. D0-M9 TaxID=3127117 RepID=UPI003010304E
MTSDPETLAAYGTQAQNYAAMTDSLKGDKHLAIFIAALPKGARVLDLGCGPGRAAGQMADHGLKVDALDAVPEMVAMAAVHPGVAARQGTFHDIAGTDLYDGIWANFSLLHAPRADMPGHLAALKTALKPGGLFHIGVKTGTGAARDKLGRHYTYYTQGELRGLLSAAGLAPHDSWTGRDRGLAGQMDDWVVIHAHG